jgi:hypothetical protein
MQDHQLRYAGQRARPRLHYEPLGDCLDRVVRGLDVRGMLRLGEYRQAWQQVVPDELQPHTQVAGLRGGVLTVAVHGAAQRYLLQVTLRHTLLAALNGVCRGRPLRDLRFVLADGATQEAAADSRPRDAGDTHAL